VRQQLSRPYSVSIMISVILGCMFILYPLAALSFIDRFENLDAYVSNNDSVLIADPEGSIVFEKNGDKKLIPASSLKVLTTLVALYSLSEDFRYYTDFYLDDASNLKIKGYGDPLLVSENIDQIAEILSQQITTIHDVILDNSYFETPILIPGVSARSNEPYDAPNGALCVNFNSVDFICRNGECASGEPQTPLLSFIQPIIKNSGLTSGRIPLLNVDDQAAFYVGHLISFFLQNRNVKINGNLHLGKIDEKTDRLIFHYVSEFKLTEVVSKLLAFSNNFIANQLLITMGAKAYGSPGTLENGIQAMKTYADSILGIDDISVVEGSGISRENRISSRMFLKVLTKFEPYAGLMRHQGKEYYKTGTLNGVRTRVGYMASKKGGMYKYVVLLNTPGKTTDAIMAQIRQITH
jgi:serine-type D-Ala-D-Ala carboxypeptidase/endopeptidase (penicillin-binding protein 4)